MALSHWALSHWGDPIISDIEFIAGVRFYRHLLITGIAMLETEFWMFRTQRLFSWPSVSFCRDNWFAGNIRIAVVILFPFQTDVMDRNDVNDHQIGFGLTFFHWIFWASKLSGHMFCFNYFIYSRSPDILVYSARSLSTLGILGGWLWESQIHYNTICIHPENWQTEYLNHVMKPLCLFF